MSKHIPAGYHTITPYLTMSGADRLIDFLQQVFEATEIERMNNPEGTIKHAEVRIGDSVLMISEAGVDFKPRPSTFYIYVGNAGAVYQRALAAGATSLMAPTDTFYGNRESGVKDPFDNYWWIATCKEELSSEEIQKRFEARSNS